MSFLDKVAFNWKHLSQQNHPVLSMIAYVLAKARLSSLVRYQRNGSILQLRSAGLARILWADPDFVLDGEIFLSTVCRPGDTVVDVGANIGVLSLLASRLVGSAGSVFAIEAHPRTYLALLNNLKKNLTTNVKPLCIAVGPEPGTVRFSDRLDDDWNKVDGNSGSLEVEVKPLDDVCDDYAHIDVLKIDVEGFELHVLKGATKVLARTDCVLLECWSEHTRGFGYTPDQLIALMDRASFHGFRLSETQGSISLTPLANVHRTGSLENWVFVRHTAWLSKRCNTSVFVD